MLVCNLTILLPQLQITGITGGHTWWGQHLVFEPGSHYMALAGLQLRDLEGNILYQTYLAPLWTK